MASATRQWCSVICQAQVSNNSANLHKIFVKPPSGKGIFVKAIPTDGSEAYCESCYKLLLTSGLEVHAISLKELIAI